MTLDEIRDHLGCEVMSGENLGRIEITECFAADLMSDALAFSEAGALLITGLTGVQSVHTTDVADLKAILYVNHKRPEPAVLDTARAKGIPVLRTPLGMFDACGRLYALGLRGAVKE
jgi:hypothetical protein